jgi:DNA-binding NtrC family response regulator
MKETRILIVDDEPQVALALSRALQHPLGGQYKVEISPVAEMALKKLRQEQYDLIITDLRMSGMGGLELLQHARQLNPEARTMLITAYGSREIQNAAHGLGAEYLAKPFGLQEFLHTVAKVLQEPEQARNERPEHQPEGFVTDSTKG